MADLKSGLEALKRDPAEGKTRWGLLPSEVEVSLALSAETTDGSKYTLGVSPVAWLAPNASVGGEWTSTDVQKSDNRITIKFKNILLEPDTIAPEKLEKLLLFLDKLEMDILKDPSKPVHK